MIQRDTTYVGEKERCKLEREQKLFPQASIISCNGNNLLVDKAVIHGLDIYYTAIGHTELKSGGVKAVDVRHDTVNLIEQPSIRNWKLLVSAREKL